MFTLYDFLGTVARLYQGDTNWSTDLYKRLGTSQHCKPNHFGLSGKVSKGLQLVLKMVDAKDGGAVVFPLLFGYNR